MHREAIATPAQWLCAARRQPGLPRYRDPAGAGTDDLGRGALGDSSGIGLKNSLNRQDAKSAKEAPRAQLIQAHRLVGECEKFRKLLTCLALLASWRFNSRL